MTPGEIAVAYDALVEAGYEPGRDLSAPLPGARELVDVVPADLDDQCRALLYAAASLTVYWVDQSGRPQVGVAPVRPEKAAADFEVDSELRLQLRREVWARVARDPSLRPRPASPVPLPPVMLLR